MEQEHHLQTDAQPTDEPISTGSYCIEIQSSSNTNIPESPTNITIHALHISMLLQNDIQGFMSQDINLSDLRSDTNKNSIFHLAASIGRSEFINEFANDNRMLLTLPNLNGDLPIHVAARACQFEVVKNLVRVSEEIGSMLEAKNEEGNTALHIALENQQQDMASFLFKKCPKTFYSTNTHKISPLYLAIKAEFWDLVNDMLDRGTTDTEADTDEAETHLMNGYSVIHAAIVAENIGMYSFVHSFIGLLEPFKIDLIIRYLPNLKM